MLSCDVLNCLFLLGVQNEIQLLSRLRFKGVEKSPAILEHLMTFRGSISTGKPEQLLSSMCLFFRFPEVERIVYTRALTYNSIRFKKPLDIFLTADSKKRFRTIFSYDFGCKQKAQNDFLASNSS